MPSEQMDPTVALQAVLAENATLRRENEELKRLLAEISQKISPYLPQPEPPASNKPTLHPVFHKCLDELELTMRAYNCLKNGNIQTIKEIVENHEGQLRRRCRRGLGQKSINEIKELLEGMDLHLGMTEADMIAWSEQRQKAGER